METQAQTSTYPKTETWTYQRDALTTDRRGTCPCCLRTMHIRKNGRLTRHGWKETGRQVGQFGQGYQWGECWGTNSRPLEETDKDCRRIIKDIRADAAKADIESGKHTDSTFDSYTWTLKRSTHFDGELEALDALNELLDTHLTPDTWSFKDGKERRQGIRVFYADARYYSFQIDRGSEGFDHLRQQSWKARATDTPEHVLNMDSLDDRIKGFDQGDYNSKYYSYQKQFRAPSYHALRLAKVVALENYIRDCQQTIDRLVEACDHHQRNPSNGTAHNPS